MLRMLSLLLLVLGAVLPAEARWAGPGGVFGFRSFGAENGLGNTAVKALARDSEGFLWVGTEDGVFRLEGSQFRRFGEEDGLPANRILDMGLAPARPKGLWVATEKGLVLWNGQRFLKPSEFGPKGVPDGIMAGAMAQGGAILIDERNKVRYVGRGAGDFKPIEGLPWEPYLTAITLSPDDRTLVAALGLQVWVRREGVWNAKGEPVRLPQEPNSLWVDGKGTVWMRTANHLYTLDPKGRLAEVSTAQPLTTLGISTLAEDPEGRIWTPTTRGLIWVGAGGSGFIGEDEGLPRGAAGVLFVDPEGTLWTGGDGLHKRLGEGRWTTWTRDQGLPSDIVWTVHRAGDGRLWAGTAGGAAVMEQGRWRVIPGTTQHQIMAMASDPAGRVWLGISPNSSLEPSGVWVCEAGQRSARRVNLPGMPPNAAILGLYRNGPKELLIAAAWAGLWRVDPSDPGLKAERIAIPGWPKEYGVQWVVGDGKGGFWTAGGSWAAHFNGRTWAALGPDGGLPTQDGVLAMSPAPGESVWMSYHLTKGVDRLQRQGDRLVLAERLGQGHPVAQHQIYSLLTESDGTLWIGTNRGALRWDGKRAERYGRNAGLPGEDCSQNALWLDPDGDLFVGLSVGIARGELARRTPQLPPAAVIVAAEDARNHSLLGEALPQVRWEDRTLTFRYATGGSRWTEDCAFQVRLAGLEQEWRTTKLPEARYTELSPGRYRFEVRTVTFLGETGEPVGFDVEILAPWWQKPYALGLWALLLGLLVVGFLRWRTAQLRRRNAHLEALVQERTAALEAANEALKEASLTDPLTGLHNRRYLAVTMPEEEIRLRRVFRNHLDRGESPLGRNEDLVLLLADLDHFKRVNDTYGHAAGDAVLQQTAQVMRNITRSSDTLVRWGGEEFLLVAKRTERDRADLIAQNLCSAIRNHTFELGDGRTLRCTISVGYAACPILDQNPEAFTWEDAAQAADQCLYAVKREGRDGWMGVHTPGPLDPVEVGPRLRVDIEGLAAEGKIVLRRSPR